MLTRGAPRVCGSLVLIFAGVSLVLGCWGGLKEILLLYAREFTVHSAEM